MDIFEWMKVAWQFENQFQGLNRFDSNLNLPQGERRKLEIYVKPGASLTLAQFHSQIVSLQIL